MSVRTVKHFLSCDHDVAFGGRAAKLPEHEAEVRHRSVGHEERVLGCVWQFMQPKQGLKTNEGEIVRQGWSMRRRGDDLNKAVDEIGMDDQHKVVRPANPRHHRVSSNQSIVPCWCSSLPSFETVPRHLF